MPTAYGYARVSHRNQIEKDDSQPAQAARAKGLYDFKLAPEGIAWGGVESDEMAVSAYRKPFCKRAAGKRLMEKLKPGDHLIFDKIDRVWRSIADFVDLMKWFKEHKITIHFVSLRGATVQMGTPMGDFMIGVMVHIAELESHTNSFRIREAKAATRSSGLWVGGNHVPYGCKVVGEKSRKNRRLVWDENQVELCLEVVALIESGKSQRQVADELEKRLCERSGLQFVNSAFKKRTFGSQQVRQMYKRGRLIQKLGLATDPNTLTFTELEASLGLTA